MNLTREDGLDALVGGGAVIGICAVAEKAPDIYINFFGVQVNVRPFATLAAGLASIAALYYRAINCRDFKDRKSKPYQSEYNSE